MATLNKGRRAALIPSVETLSPEEVQNILRNRIAQPVIPPPNSCPAISAIQYRTRLEESSRLHVSHPPQSEGIKLESERRRELDLETSDRSYDLRRELATPYTKRANGDANKTVQWAQPGKEYARSRFPHNGMITHYRENKRKHAVFARDEDRRCSDEVLKDIPHMSEIDPDHGFRTSCLDIFGSKGQRSLFVETGRPSQSGIAIPKPHSNDTMTPALYGVSPRDTSASGPPFWSL
ncbi:hypothetical protein MMC16_001179 [Acarospora aff. strigata]|nr:hypothetical protein [Acarospora aff. strigata]